MQIGFAIGVVLPGLGIVVILHRNHDRRVGVARGIGVAKHVIPVARSAAGDGDGPEGIAELRAAVDVARKKSHARIADGEHLRAGLDAFMLIPQKQLHAARGGIGADDFGIPSGVENQVFNARRIRSEWRSEPARCACAISMIAPMTHKFLTWDTIPLEEMSDLISRKVVTGEKAMLAHIYLKKDAVVPEHHHESEQITYIVEGALKFELEGREVIVRKGEVLLIPSNVPHRAVALEDTIDIDVFAPIRMDWVNKTDSICGAGNAKDRPSLIAQGLRYPWIWGLRIASPWSPRRARDWAKRSPADWRGRAPSWRCVRATGRSSQPPRREILGKRRRDVRRPVDVTEEAAVRAFVAETEAKFGRIDICVTNAGGPPAKSVRRDDDGRMAPRSRSEPDEHAVFRARGPPLMRARGGAG